MKNHGGGGGKETDDDDDTKKEKREYANIIDPAVAAMLTGRRGRTLFDRTGWRCCHLGAHYPRRYLVVPAIVIVVLIVRRRHDTDRMPPTHGARVRHRPTFQTLLSTQVRGPIQALVSCAILSGIVISSLNGPHAAIVSAHTHTHIHTTTTFSQHVIQFTARTAPYVAFWLDNGRQLVVGP
jgi:hypothetical protein